ncbi:MAG: SDR family NAD(P)-dependent oxidoreductase [Acidobacteriia bacterium]|nr:SDR family NAD(P)-dependent oxidoreductase [Terriglobia bacterium]
MRVLVTGGTGFIGSHLVRRLIDAGNDVHVFARKSSDLFRIQDAASEITLWRGDVTDFDSVTRTVDAVAPEIVFHLAGDTSGRRWSRGFSELDASIDVNLLGTLNLLRALHRAPKPPGRFIRAGGLAEYGDAPVPFDESARELPVSAYGASQAATTVLLSALQSQLSFLVITLRFAAVYGPGRSEEFFLPALIVRCLEGGEFEMTSGDQPWDLLYVDDAVDALLCAAEAPAASGEIVNIGSGCAYTLREVAERAVAKIGSGRLRIGAISASAGDIRKLYCRIEKARRMLEWEPRVDLDAGLDRTIAWYRQRAGKPA